MSRAPAVYDRNASPTAGAVFWRALFGNSAPVEVEIGSGDGVFLLAIADRVPAHNFLGIERSPGKARRLAARVQRRGVANVRTLQADAACIVTRLIPDASVAAYHVYFPDPWPKRGHARRRLFSAPLVAGLARTLAPGGRLFVATDVAGYAQVIEGAVLDDRRFAAAASAGVHPGLQTSFARKYRAAGRLLHPAVYLRADGA